MPGLLGPALSLWRTLTCMLEARNEGNTQGCGLGLNTGPCAGAVLDGANDAPKNRSSKSRRSTGLIKISYALLSREVCFADSSSRPGFLSGDAIPRSHERDAWRIRGGRRNTGNRNGRAVTPAIENTFPGLYPDASTPHMQHVHACEKWLHKDSEPTRMPLEHKLAVCGPDSAGFSRARNSEYLVPIFILDRKGPDVAHAGEGQHQEAYARLSNSSASQQVPSCLAVRTGAR